MPDKQITSISDLIGELKVAVDPSKGPTWYRGHSDSTWKLLPHFDRLINPAKEPELVDKFRQNANLLLQAPPASSYDFGWMFLMQHYGVPTRLLDWTESPLVALYFALEEPTKHDDKDAAIWLLYPIELNKQSNQEQAYIPSFEDEWLGNYSVSQYSKGKDRGILPIAAIATRNNPRIQAQLGVFTISHRKKIAIEDIEGGSHCIKFTIPSAAKPQLRSELKILGLSRFQIFPELASIGSTMKEELS